MLKDGDIVKIKSLEQYEEDGDEITELIEKFAGQKVRVLRVYPQENHFTAINEKIGTCSFNFDEVGSTLNDN